MKKKALFSRKTLNSLNLFFFFTYIDSKINLFYSNKFFNSIFAVDCQQIISQILHTWFCFHILSIPLYFKSTIFACLSCPYSSSAIENSFTKCGAIRLNSCKRCLHLWKKIRPKLFNTRWNVWKFYPNFIKRF